MFRISNNLIDNDGNVSDYFPVVILAAALIHSAAAILAIIIVRSITQRQDQRFHRIGHSEHQLPPNPPSFNQQI